MANGGSLPVGSRFVLSVKAYVGGVEVASNTRNYHATGMIAAGADHALVLPFDGSKVWAWGYNYYKQLGFNYPALSTVAQGSRIVVMNSAGATLQGVKAIAAGTLHSMALLNDGTVKTWGSDNNGQLGDNAATIASQLYLATVCDSTGVAGTKLSNVVEIAAGNLHSLAITSTAGAVGQVWGWGDNASGELGNNTILDKTFPAATLTSALVPLTGIEEVSGGAAHSVARSSAGLVYAWGLNSSGQVLGTTATTTPVKVATAVTSFGDAEHPAVAGAVTCGENFTLVVRASDGTVWGWGSNTKGELGNNSAVTTPARVPVKVVLQDGSSLLDVVQVEAGLTHAMALDAAGRVYTWGLNTNGCLGDGSATAVTASRKYAKEVVLPTTTASGQPRGMVVAIAAGPDFSMALTDTGNLFTWGNQVSGRLGNGSVAAGNVLSPNNSPGQPVVSYRPPAVSLTVAPAPAVQPAALTLTAAPIDSTSSFSRVDFYQGATLLTPSPTGPPWTLTLPALPQGNYTFSATAVDLVGATASAVAPVVVQAPTATAAIVAGSTSEGSATPAKFRFTINKAQTADLTVNYTVDESGLNSATAGADYAALSGSAVIPAGTLTSADIAVTAFADWESEGTESVVVALAPSSTYLSSAVPITLSIANVAAAADPQVIPPESAQVRVSVVRIDAATGVAARYTLDGTDPLTTSASATSGTLFRIAPPVTTKVRGTKTGTTPSRVVTAPFTGLMQVAAGGSHSLLLDRDGKIWSWGENWPGCLGLGDEDSRGIPTLVPNLSGVSALGAGASHSVAIKSDGSVLSCGLNDAGQLGVGTTAGHSTFVPVPGLTLATAVGAGEGHTVVLRSDGTVRSFGSNTEGQLGNNSYVNSTVPVTVSGLTGVVALAVGGNHTLALKSDGSVKAWGRGGSGPGSRSPRRRSWPRRSAVAAACRAIPTTSATDAPFDATGSRLGR